MKATLLLGTLGLLALAACGQDATTPAATAAALQLPADQVVYDVKHVMTTDGVRRALLRGDSAYLREQGQRFDLSGVELEFFDELGKPSGNLTSRTGEYSPASGDFIARGDVVLITNGPNGPRRLETEELHYEPRADQLWSPVPFVMKEGGQTSRGQSFRSDTRFRNFNIQGAQGSIPSAEIRF